MIGKLDNQRQHICQNFGPIDIQQNKKQELTPINQVYQESFPFWTPPHQVPYQSFKEGLASFSLGSRVLNLNSTQREYIPFGIRGTVIGRTETKVLVVFDEQFLHGTTLFGHCGPYRGAQVQPRNLLNLSKQFMNLAKDNFELVKKFQEKPLPGEAEYNLEGTGLGLAEASKRAKVL